MSKEKVRLAPEKRNAKFAGSIAQDIVPSDFTVINTFDKGDEGNFIVIEIKGSKQHVLVNTGELLAEHNDAVAKVKGAKRIFVGEALKAGEVAEFLPTLKIGIKKKAFEFAA